MSRDITLFTDESAVTIFTQDFSYEESNKQWIALGENLLLGIMKYCHNQGIQSILVEGGTHTMETFYAAGLSNEILKIRSDVSLLKGIKSPFKDIMWDSIEQVGNNNHWLRAKENLR
jgi:diaminohydroxyphosphoribosylaminopyrimidine deaminase/5-amino-6-(5-phosphoribosylamino)uracil reductase